MWTQRSVKGIESLNLYGIKWVLCYPTGLLAKIYLQLLLKGNKYISLYYHLFLVHTMKITCIPSLDLWKIIVSFFFLIFFICSEFCHTLKWNSYEFTCVPHPDPPSHLPLHPIPLGLPSAPGPSACLNHPTWAGDLFHPR